MNEALVSRAVELLAPEPGSSVLDLYCGLGNFTLALARALARGRGGSWAWKGTGNWCAGAGKTRAGTASPTREFHVADLMQALPAALCMG